MVIGCTLGGKSLWIGKARMTPTDELIHEIATRMIEEISKTTEKKFDLKIIGIRFLLDDL